MGARQPDDIASTTVWKRTATDVLLYPSLVYQRLVLVTRTSVNLPSSHMNTYHSEYYVHTGGARTLLTSSIQTEKAKKTGNPRNGFWCSFSVVCTCRCQTNVQRCIQQLGKIIFYNIYYCVRFGIILVCGICRQPVEKMGIPIKSCLDLQSHQTRTTNET